MKKNHPSRNRAYVIALIAVLVLLLFLLIQNRNTAMETNVRYEYLTFIEMFPVSSVKYYTYSFWDMDNNGVDELLVSRQNRGNAFDAVMTIFTYNSGIEMIGEYTNEIGSFMSGIFVLDNPNYTGVVDTWHNNGIESYIYVYLDEGAIKHEEIFYVNRKGDSPVLVECSDDKELINEVMKLLEMKNLNHFILPQYVAREQRLNKSRNVDRIFKTKGEGDM